MSCVGLCCVGGERPFVQLATHNKATRNSAQPEFKPSVLDRTELYGKIRIRYGIGTGILRGKGGYGSRPKVGGRKVARLSKKALSSLAKTLGVSASDALGVTPAFLRAYALSLYVAESDGSTPLSPARAVATIAAALDLPKDRLRSTVDPVYFRENGARNPIPLPKRRTETTLAVAVAKRRNAGGTLGRWESIAAALAAALDRPVSEATVRALAAKRIDLDSSYVGRGTRAAAPKTRADATAEVVEAAK